MPESLDILDLVNHIVQAPLLHPSLADIFISFINGFKTALRLILPIAVLPPQVALIDDKITEGVDILGLNLVELIKCLNEIKKIIGGK